MRLIDAEVFAEISKKHIPEVIVNTWEEGYIDCLKVVDETPTVNAIPIEWIENYLSKWKNAETHDVAKTWWLIMKRDWEKENEIDR